MADPVLTSNNFGNIYLYYTCDRNPTASEPLTYNDISGLLMLWWNTTSGERFVCLDNTEDAMVWEKLADGLSLEGMLEDLGVPIQVDRARSLRGSPAFSTSYRPSTTSDVEVNLTLNFSFAVLSPSSTINIQVSQDDSNWVTIGSIAKTLALAAVSWNEFFTFTVPIGSYYRIVQASGSIASIVSIYELSV